MLVSVLFIITELSLALLNELQPTQENAIIPKTRFKIYLFIFIQIVSVLIYLGGKVSEKKVDFVTIANIIAFFYHLMKFIYVILQMF